MMLRLRPKLLRTQSMVRKREIRGDVTVVCVDRAARKPQAIRTIYKGNNVKY